MAKVIGEANVGWGPRPQELSTSDRGLNGCTRLPHVNKPWNQAESINGRLFIYGSPR